MESLHQISPLRTQRAEEVADRVGEVEGIGNIKKTRPSKST